MRVNYMISASSLLIEKKMKKLNKKKFIPKLCNSEAEKSLLYMEEVIFSNE